MMVDFIAIQELPYKNVQGVGPYYPGPKRPIIVGLAPMDISNYYDCAIAYAEAQFF